MGTTGGVGQQLRLRLFLEGIEVPCISASIQANLNAPAAASIQVIPTDSVLELKARTMVHLFYWDFNEDLPDPPSEAVDDSPYKELYQKGYKMAFGGELTGLTMAKTPLGRQAVLQCADWSTYWDTTYQIFISWSPGGNFLGDRSSVWGGGNSMFHNILSSHASVMSSYLRRRPKSEGLQDVKGLMGGIISLLEAMGGVPRHVSGVNDFFTIAELKNHLLQQIVAEQNDDTARRLFSSKSFSAWLNRRLTSLGQLVSFRDMLKLLFHWIYYEVVPITSPMFLPAVNPTTTENIARGRQLSKGLTGTQRNALSSILKIIQNYSGSGSDGASLKTLIKNQLAVNEPTVAADLSSKLSRVVESAGNLPAKSKSSIDEAITDLSVISSIPGRSSINPDTMAQAIIGSGSGSNDRDIVQPRRPGGFAAAASGLNRNRAQWARARRKLLQAMQVPDSRIRRGRRRKKSRARAQLDRLHAQVFRPDCFFVAPPRCNVLFPDQYTQFQFRRNFLQEVTRLRLTTGLQFISGKGAGFLTNSHFAPPLSEIKRIARVQGNRGIRTLLPWEKFTGILPKFEHISEVNYIANRRQRKLTRDIRGKGKAFAQRAANFNFVKYRFAPRTMTVKAKFAPQFIPGFPGLVIDKPFIVDPEAVQQALSASNITEVEEVTLSDLLANIGPLAQFFRAPTQYLGMPAAVSHTVDQSGGFTSITFTHARTHRITNDDYLDPLLSEISRKSIKRTESTVLDAEKLIQEGDYEKLQFLIGITPQGDTIPRFSQFGSEDSNFSEFIENEEDANAQDLLDKRPNSVPDLASFDQLAPVIFTTSDPGLFEGSRVQVQSTFSSSGVSGEDDQLTATDVESSFSFRGPVKENTLHGTGTLILEPAPYGEIRPGSRGLKRRGKVVQVQLLSDAAVRVSTADIDQLATSRRAKARIRRQRRRGGREDSVFMWRKAVVYEEVTSRSTTNTVPIEEAIRPPWFSPLYSNMFIGDEIYHPFFGTGSIVDQALFITPEGEAFLGDSEERKKVLARIREADGDAVKISQIMEDAKASTIGRIPDVERSVDALAFLYGEVRRQGLDVQRFIANYTSRPIATLKDILGSQDLEYQQEGDQLVKVSGEAGFHSTAVAPFGDLLGLVDNPDLEIPRLHRRGKRIPISKELDPRPGRRKKVQDYADEIGGSRGSLGVGLLG